MPSTRDFFLKESDEYVGGLRELTGPDAPTDGAELRRLARALRGCAQMAREDSVFRGARILEAAAHAVAEGRLAWDEDARGRLGQTLDDLWALIEEGEADAAEAAAVKRLTDIRARWQEAGVEVAEEPAADAPRAAEASSPEPPAALREYAAREVVGILEAVNQAIQQLRADPRDRDALRSILLRQRALMGAAGLAGLPAVSDPLHVMDETARLAASQDRAVEGQWLEVFELARAALEEAAEPLGQGSVPPTDTPTLERLRVLRQRLVEGRGGQDPDGEMEEEIPVEVVNFFRTEARTRLEKLRRVAADLEAEGGEGEQLRPQLEEALTALAHTAGTFGFVAVGREVERAAERVASLPAGDAGVLIAALEGAIEAALERGGAVPSASSATLAELGLSNLAGEATRAGEGGADGERASAGAGAQGAERAPSGEAAGPGGPDRRAETVPEPPPATAAPAASSFFTPSEAEAEADLPLIPIEELCYSGEAALQRALDLRTDIERVLDQGAPAGPLLDEVFDLIRLGLR
ncbi:MAG TPA: hypothetical protein VMK65_06975 [Longimicrobiales bacterium]|nr:hypothetical protein [Longimicrobiales bacterium]